MNQYEELKKRQEEEFNKFPIAYAMSNQQLKGALKKLGLTEHDEDKVMGIGFGGIIRISDKEAYSKLIDKHFKELGEAINSDITGEGFIKDMFESELENTGSITGAVIALGLTTEEINKKRNLLNGLNLALNKHYCQEEEMEK